MSDGAKSYFRGLDLVRGIAALAVLVYHSDFAFGLRGRLLPAGYTAVDLFFVLSGFVIAMTYEEAVVSGALSFKQMAIRRVARLYPLFLLTTLVGLVAMTARYRANYGYLDVPALSISAALNLFMLPTFAPPYGSQTLFPYNAASWSIFYEVFINAVFFAVFARLRTATLTALWFACGIATAAVIGRFGNVDLGWGLSNFVAAFARVTFSFLSGMLVWRFYRAKPWTNPVSVLLGLVALHLCYMQARSLLPPTAAAAADFMVVALFLPILVAAGVGAKLRRSGSRMAGFLGDTSYAVYLTQDALIIAAAGFTQTALKTKIYDLSPWSGLAVFAVCIVESYICFLYFEVPMRRLIRSAGRTARTAQQADFRAAPVGKASGGG